MPCEKEPCNDPGLQEIWGFKQTNQHSKYTHFEGPSCQESVLVPAKAVYNICSLSTVATLEGGFKLSQQTTSYCSYCALQVGCQAASCKVYVNYTPHNSTLDRRVLFCAVCTVMTNQPAKHNIFWCKQHSADLCCTLLELPDLHFRVLANLAQWSKT